jgi:hypothetical protein
MYQGTVALRSETHGLFEADIYRVASIDGALTLEVDPAPGEVAAYVASLVGENDYTDMSDFELAFVLAYLNKTAVEVRDEILAKRNEY